MKLHALNLGIATAVVVALSWVICTLLVAAAPGPMQQMAGAMMHADFQMAGWRLGWSGFFVGLVSWSVIAGVYVWAIAALYNRLTK